MAHQILRNPPAAPGSLPIVSRFHKPLFRDNFKRSQNHDMLSFPLIYIIHYHLPIKGITHLLALMSSG